MYGVRSASTDMKTQDQVIGKFLQAITSVSLALVGFIAVSALDKISDLDEKINNHIVASEHRITVLEHRE
tara:strand:- start:1608 stop:1817 length:210 start_codon:yes stop_codon:yes gene_type:complete